MESRIAPTLTFRLCYDARDISGNDQRLQRRAGMRENRVKRVMREGGLALVSHVGSLLLDSGVLCFDIFQGSQRILKVL